MSQQRAIILHGKPSEDEYYDDRAPSPSNEHWLPWLQNQLRIHDINAQTPEIPNAYAPEWDAWIGEFDRHVTDEPMLLVGHSCGAGFLLRWLSENPDVIVSRLVLVAPWLDPNRDDTDDFFDFDIDEDLEERVDQLHLVYSTDDFPSVLTSVNMILEALPDAIQHRYFDQGHFTSSDMGTNDFPDLLDLLVR